MFPNVGPAARLGCVA